MRWVIRCGVLLALAVVLYTSGPRAWVALASRLGFQGQEQHAVVDLDRVGLQRAPAWLRSDPVLARSVLEELSPVLRRSIDSQDRAALEEVRAALAELSWVASAHLRPAAAGHLGLRLILRRPVLEVIPEGPRAGELDRVFVAADGVCMHRTKQQLRPAELPLPQCRMREGVVPGSRPLCAVGLEHPDPRVLAAAAVAEEWRTALRPKCPDAPLLVEVDASNLDYRLLADRRLSEVRVGLRRRDGGVTYLDYGHPPGHPMPRVAVTEKAAVLANILRAHPGLAGVDRADLRFVNTWQDWVRGASIPR